AHAVRAAPGFRGAEGAARGLPVVAGLAHVFVHRGSGVVRHLAAARVSALAVRVFRLSVPDGHDDRGAAAVAVGSRLSAAGDLLPGAVSAGGDPAHAAVAALFARRGAFAPAVSVPLCLYFLAAVALCISPGMSACAS